MSVYERNELHWSSAARFTAFLGLLVEEVEQPQSPHRPCLHWQIQIYTARFHQLPALVCRYHCYRQDSNPLRQVSLNLMSNLKAQVKLLRDEQESEGETPRIVCLK